MTRPELPPPSAADDLLRLAERFKRGLIEFATNGEDPLTPAEFLSIRKTLRASPAAAYLPDFIAQCRDLGDFWAYVKGQFSKYEERRRFLAESLNPLLNHLEDEGASGLGSHLQMGEVLGQGGFGVVHRCQHTLLNLDFALKLFAPAFGEEGAGHMDRFFREARILFRLNHPNIIRVYDVGMLRRRPFIRMEYFPGKNLNDVLRDHGPLRPSAALHVVQAVSEALNHAHSVGVVHRDLKLSNVMVDRPRQFRVIDFGLGVFVEEDLVSRITKLGEGVVSGLFTAPELIANPRRIDPRSDLFSLGALWYNLIVGRPPAGTSAASSLGELPGVSGAYTEVVLRCLDDVERRFQSASELLDALAQLAP